MTPDKEAARAFLDALDSHATVWCFQTFDDNRDRLNGALAGHRTGTLDDLWPWLCAQSKQGAGVFVTINETDGKGRDKDNIQRVRAVFVDTDGADHEPILAHEPHIVVESSPGNYHDYWLTLDCPKDEFKPAQKRMIDAWGTDKNVNDLPRVMRLPGFPHQKVDSRKGLDGTPFMVRMIENTSFLGPDKWSDRKAKIHALGEQPRQLTLSERATPNFEISVGDIQRGKKTVQDYQHLLTGMKTDGEKHGSVRDTAASMAAQGCKKEFVEAFIREQCPVYDRNVQDLIDSAFDKFAKRATVEVKPDPNPVDLWGSFEPPELPQGLLPRIIEDFARANGDQMGADPAGLAVAALVTCAAAIPDAIQIKVKIHANWCESARLWAALIGPPSAKKSPIITAATGPLCHLDVKMMRDWQARLADYHALPKEERLGPPPPQTRLRIEDATVEAAQQVLEGSPWGVLLLQDELSGFFGQMDKYNGGKGAQADRAFWLRAFNGGQFALNRVGRGAAIIDNLSISMLGGIQPEPIRKVAGDAVDDGLLQRLFPIMLRNATMGRDEPMPPVNSEYQFLIEGLRNLTPPGFGGIGKLTFDDGAQAIRRELEGKHLDLQSMETVNRKLASHIGKLDGLFARLCVVWHCVQYVEESMFCGTLDDVAGGLPEIVTEATARRVADFLHGFLLGHAIGFYSGVLGLSDDHDRLTAIAGYILTHKLERITNRDVQRGDRTMRGLKDHEIRPLLEQLDALGWLERMEPPRPSSPPHWRVNPTVHAKFADRAAREADRRQDARATIQRLVQQ